MSATAVEAKSDLPPEAARPFGDEAAVAELVKCFFACFPSLLSDEDSRSIEDLPVAQPNSAN
jgi:hypothetical protein